MQSTEKQWYLSKTIIGGLIAAIIGAMTTVGFVQGDALSEEAPAITELVVGIGLLVSSALSIWGRLTAKTKLTLTNGKGKVPIIILCLLVVVLAGCTEVQMSPRYSMLLDRALSHAEEFDERCQDPNNPNRWEDCRLNSERTTAALALMADARDGEAD